MPPTNAPAGVQITLRAADRRYDLVVPVGAQVTHILSTLGIASRAHPHAIATPSGQVLGPRDRLDDSVAPGTTFTVVTVTTHVVTRDIRNLDRSHMAAGVRQERVIDTSSRAGVTGARPPEEATRRRRPPVTSTSESTTPRSSLATSKAGGLLRRLRLDPAADDSTAPRPDPPEGGPAGLHRHDFASPP